jgi:hypothetical protein
MTHKCIKSRANEALQELDFLEYQRNLLDIAVEQCDSESGIIPERIEILIASYLEHIEPHVHNLRFYLNEIASVAEPLWIDVIVHDLKF